MLDISKDCLYYKSEVCRGSKRASNKHKGRAFEMNNKRFGLDFLIDYTKQSKKELSWRCKLKTQSNITKWIAEKHIPEKHLEKLEEFFGVEKYYINREISSTEQTLVKEMLREKKLEVGMIQHEEDVYHKETGEYLGTVYKQVTDGTEFEKELLSSSISIRKKIEKMFPVDYCEGMDIEEYLDSMHKAPKRSELLEGVITLMLNGHMEVLNLVLNSLNEALLGIKMPLCDFGSDAENDLIAVIRDTIIYYKEGK